MADYSKDPTAFGRKEGYTLEQQIREAARLKEEEQATRNRRETHASFNTMDSAIKAFSKREANIRKNFANTGIHGGPTRGRILRNREDS